MEFYELDLMPFFIFISAINAIVRINRRRRVYAIRGPSARRPRQEFWEMTSTLSDNDFHRTFRMSRDTFKGLVSACHPHISPRYTREEDIEKKRRSHVAGKDIQTEVKMELFLRTMVGGSFLDINILFRIGRSSVFRIFRQVLATVLEVLSWESFPDTDALSRCMINPLSGWVGALDGLQVQIISPPLDQNPFHYFSRKRFFTLPVQAVVDAKYHFIGCSILAVESTHDNIAFMLSDLHRYLESDSMPSGFWIAGDKAYSCSENLIIPFARSLSTAVHDAFNFFHSSHRVHVEQAFGILKRRSGILQKPLAFDIALSTKIIPAAMKLHNVCINKDGGVPEPPRTRLEMQVAEERMHFWWTWCNEGYDVDADIVYEVEEMIASARRAEERSETRCKLVKIVRRENLRRPELLLPNDMLPTFLYCSSCSIKRVAGMFLSVKPTLISA